MDNYIALRSLQPLAVLAALGIDTGKFKKRSNKPEWSAPCPIHQSKNNQHCFSIHEDGRYGCFSCSAKGRGAIDLTQAVRNCGFKEAVAFLEGLTLPEQPKTPPTVISDAVDGDYKPLEKDTWSKFKVPCPWLEQRIPEASVRERYGVFCYNNPARKSAYSGRVMIPVKDAEGRLFGYLGRLVPPPQSDSSSQPPASTTDSPKYLFPKNLPKSHFLFGSAELRQSHGQERQRIVYLVESPFCVMKFASLGLPAVSPFGWSVSQEQIESLTTICKGVCHLPDRNKHDACRESLAKLAQRLWLRFPPLPDGVEDPESLSREQILQLTK